MPSSPVSTAEVPGGTDPAPLPSVPAAASASPPAAGPSVVRAEDSPIDAAMKRLEGIEQLPISEHITRYEAAHKSLQDALSTIDQT